MSQIAFSSIPVWARPHATVEASPDPSGRLHVVIGVGPDAGDGMRRWVDALPADVALRPLTFDDVDLAADALRDEITGARVGIRVVIVASPGAALALRGVATSAGLEDDEIHVVASSDGPIEVFCSHCRAVTSTESGVDDVIDCVGCRRHLLIYHHVSRRSGRYLGFMVDAETSAIAGESTQ